LKSSFGLSRGLCTNWRIKIPHSSWSQALKVRNQNWKKLRRLAGFSGH
jgi:hypothetical protein